MTKLNSDELEAPNWMNEEFFEEVLRKFEGTVLVTEVKLSPVSSQADHYGSVMFRAAITYNTYNSKGNLKSLIIKTMPELEGHKKDLLGETYIFETEIAIYSQTIPKFEAELRKNGDNTVLGAKALYYSLEPRKIIIFEDLCEPGYEVNRDRHCTLKEVKAAFLKLAKWHAVSYKLVAEGDTSVTSYKESILTIKDADFMTFMTSGIVNLIEKLENVDELKQYVPKLREFQKDMLRRCINSFKSYQQKPSKGINVLCHGDFHRKNMMFKNSSSGKLEDAMMLDFQVCYFGPAILDVLYGMCMLGNDDIRKNHYDEIIHYYSSNFIEILRKLKFEGEIPTISDFFIEILQHRHWEMFLISTFLPIWNVFASEDIDHEKILSSNESRKKVYDNAIYIEELKILLPRMFYKGYLE